MYTYARHYAKISVQRLCARARARA